MIEFEIKNMDQLQKIFAEMHPSYQRRVLNTAAQKSGRIIINQAKRNFNQIKKGKSQTGYKWLRSAFKIEKLDKEIGAKIGVKYYKAIWLEKGTVNRKTRKKLYRGKIEATHFFENAVETKKQEAVNSFQQNIILAMKNLIKRLGGSS